MKLEDSTPDLISFPELVSQSDNQDLIDVSCHLTTQSSPTSLTPPPSSVSQASSTSDDRNNIGDSENEDGDEDEKKWVVNGTPKPRKISEKKRADNAKFDLWIEQNQQRLTRGVSKLVADEDRSVNSLIREFENKRIITSPRDYQLELFELAKTQNTIAVLDTGSGKTLIAALLLRWTIHNELDARSKGLPKRIAFFLVDKVALVFQQHSVLTCNLDYPIEKFCGDMVQNADKDFWAKTFGENMGIVCTAEILYSCLAHSYIRMDQLNLLVFDEAHHTKKNHPYARIIKDFYAPTEDDKKPRILGMTASPVDAQMDPKIAAAELEGLLHSKIATVSDPTALQNSTSMPKEEMVLQYDPKSKDWTTDLDKALKKLIGKFGDFSRAFAFTSMATAELGPWVADRFWQLYFRQEDLAKLEINFERSLLQAVVTGHSNDLNINVNPVRDAHNLVNQHQFARPSLDRSQLSSKVIELVKALQTQFSHEDHDRRCIVFVKQRNMATLLVDLLKQPDIQIPGLKPGYLIGGGRNESSWDLVKVGYRDQVLTIIKFKKGELNCIFATSVAEEGLDIPDCNVVIRFDLHDTLIQYIQSRGRARQKKSVYIHMAEKANDMHIRKVVEARRQEEALRRFCMSMPEDRKLTGNNYNMDYFLRMERGQKQYTIPETGAKLNFKQGLICLANFVSSLPHPPEVHLTPEYIMLSLPGGFQCEVVLPATSPIRRTTGGIYSSKAVAKCSAAFEMCLLLLKDNYLDTYLRPVFTKQLPAMRNARLAISSKKKAEYGMKIKPEIWSQLGEPTELFVMALTLEHPVALGRVSTPVLLLTRQAMPQVASFPLYFGTDRSSTVRCIPLSGSVKATAVIAESLTAFTLRVFNDVFSKEYEANASQLPYFLAPTRKDHAFDFHSVPDPGNLVDWNVVNHVKENVEVKYKFEAHPDHFFENKFVWDAYDGSRKFILRRRTYDLKATDRVPEGIVPPPHRAWRTTCETQDILNYSNSLWSKARRHYTYREDQPVVEAELLPIRRNMLDDDVDEDLEPKKCFLALEILKISPLPVEFVAMVYTFPAIIHRIDSNLVALDACKMLGLVIRPDLALEAFTKDSDNSGEHDVEQVNFQRGMGSNYERLEFLGDAFLKLSTTIAIYTQIPDKDEFEYHVERMLLICNKNLFNNALDVKLEEYVRSMAFNRRTWYPEGLILKKGKRKDLTRKHTLADKSIADVCEAIIGAAYLTAQDSENKNYDLAIQAVTAVVKSKNHAMMTWSDYYAAYKKPAWQTAPANSVQIDMAEKFHKRMGYQFKYPRLLRSAFQHPTYPTIYEKLPSYQRLEFLGDALLDMACIDYLFRAFPGADPQWLTEHKMAMVSNQFLGCLAVYMQFHKAMAFCSPSIQKEVAEYVAEIEEALRIAKEDATAAGKDGEKDFAKDFWVHCSRPPKCLPDVVEAYIGAIFVDSEYDYSTVQQFFAEHVKPFFEDMRLYDTFANKHPVTFLTSLMQTKFRCVEWRLLTKEIMLDDGIEGGAGVGLDEEHKQPQVVCAVRVHGLTLAHSVAQSSRYAKIAAAKKGLKVLKEMEVDEFRKEYGCGCVVEEEKEVGKKKGNERECVNVHGTAV
ncbi:dicer-like protein 1 [Cladorrhinum sp. PSN259]|nr:dicer-like protein 1 [Cladorrhinum sp. PSN259]